MERSCKNCQQRRVGCHANCERYKADCAQDAKRRAYEKQLTYYIEHVAAQPQRAAAKRSEGGRLGGLYRGYFKVHSPTKKEKK